MAADLPPGKWSALLVGPWWPARPDAPTAGVTHWNEQGRIKEAEATAVDNDRQRLAANNRGRTADDINERYWDGVKLLRNVVDQCDVKSTQSNRVVDAVNNLRDRLGEVAKSGNDHIDRILSRKGLVAEQVAEINGVIANANSSAAHTSGTAMSNIIDATQRVLDVTIGGDARTWLRNHGVNLDGPPPSRPISQHDLARWLGDEAAADTGTKPLGDSQPWLGSAPAAAPTGRTSVVSAASPSSAAPQANSVPWMGDAPAASSTPPAGGSAPSPATGAPAVGTPSGRLPGGPPVGAPALPGSGLSPAALGRELSPQSLGQSFTSGMAAGQPAAAGAHSLSAGTMSAAAEPPPQTPVAPAAPVAHPAVPSVVSAPTISGVESSVAEHGSVAPPPVAGAPVSAGGVPVAPPVMTGEPVFGPVGAGPAVSAGLLPAYGSDLRPPVVAPPVVPSGPVSGAPVASSSPGSSATAGGSLLSPVQRAVPGSATGQAAATPTGMAGASVTAATTGAAAGDMSGRAAEQARLQRIVDAVARQEPRLAWAAGLRDDGRTTLLVTDLAAGWIPPHVRLPANVTLLEPAARRRDVSVVDLLGAVTAAAVHQPNHYVAEPGPEDPTLTGDHAARTAPMVDEFGPTLVDAVRRRDGLPRITQTVAQAATRRMGVLETEIDQLRECIAGVQRSVIAGYPGPDLAAVGDWMLLGAIDAMLAAADGITGQGRLHIANYHLAWAIATSTGGRCR